MLTPSGAVPQGSGKDSSGQLIGPDNGIYTTGTDGTVTVSGLTPDSTIIVSELNKVNRVNNLVSVHKNCLNAINNPGVDISGFEAKAQKKIIGYREKLVISHTRNN